MPLSHSEGGGQGRQGVHAQLLPEAEVGPPTAWFTCLVLELTLGMTIFFVLSIRLTGMRDEGAGARRFMVIMAVVFGVLTIVQFLTR
ncbi:MAG: hypothetical protein OEV20_01870 [Actinomycetota bacterium]|nr:hypothetical protein [Actinomycetota bacterium]